MFWLGVSCYLHALHRLDISLTNHETWARWRRFGAACWREGVSNQLDVIGRPGDRPAVVQGLTAKQPLVTGIVALTGSVGSSTLKYIFCTEFIVAFTSNQI